MTTSAPRRRRRWIPILGGIVLVLLGTGFGYVRLELEGPALGDKVATTLNKRMRGRIEIGSIEWPTSALEEVLTGGWIPITLRDVRVWDDCALNTGAAALDDVRWGDPNEDCTLDDRPDPDPNSRRRPRKLLLRTDRITAEVDAHALLFGNHDLVFRHVWVHGGEALLEQTREPYPLHAYDRTIVSIVTAFYPRMRAGFRAGIYADPPPPIFDLRDIHVDGINLTVHMTPDSSTGAKAGYVTTARFEGVDIDAGPNPRNDAYLYMDSIDPLVAKFYVNLTATARRARIWLWDGGPREAFRLPAEGAEVYPPGGRRADYQLELTDIQVHRLAQLPVNWAHKDYVANTLELDIEARTRPCATALDPHPDPATGARVHLTGQLRDYWDRPYDGYWDLALDGENLGPTIRSCIKSTVGGDHLDGRITVTGPFVASPKLGLTLHDLDFDVPLRSGEEPLRLTLAEVIGSIDLVNEQGSIDKTTALIRGGKEPGEVAVEASFGLKPYNARAHVEITKAIDVSRFLDPAARPLGRFLQGRLTAVGDADIGFALEDFDLALGRTPTEKAIRAHKGRLFTSDDFDTINIQRVRVDAGRSHATVDGSLDLAKDLVDVTIDGYFPDLDVWLERFGLPAFVKSAGGGIIKIKGPITNPTINVATDLGGVPCLDKVRIVDSQYDSDRRILDIRDLRSTGLGGTLRGSARLAIGAKGSGNLTRIEKLHVEGRHLDAARLCEIGAHLKGTIDTVDADLAGTIDPRRSGMDWLSLAKITARTGKLTIAGDRFANVALCLNGSARDDQRCRPRTAYLDADDLQQCDAGKRNGFCAVATATRVGGGHVDATIARIRGSRGAGAQLAGTISADEVPIAIVDKLLGAQPALDRAFGPRPGGQGQVGGSASMTLHLQGSPDAPQATGAIRLLRSWIGGAFVGDLELAVAPGTIAVGNGKQPGIAFKGSALAGRLSITGTIGTQAPYPLELAVTGRRLDAGVLVDLQRRFGLPLPVEAWFTGTVTMRTELDPASKVEPEAWVELSELVGVATYRAEDGRLVPLRIAAVAPDNAAKPAKPDGRRGKRPAVSLRVTPSSIEFKCRGAAGPVDCTTRLEVGAQNARPAAWIDLRGHAAPKHVAIEAVGKVDLAPITPLVGTVFAELSGGADVAASIGGTLDKPVYEASLLLRDVHARPVGGDTYLAAPSGLIKLANGSLGFTNVKVRVQTPAREPAGAAAGTRVARGDEDGELNLKGLIALDGLTPTGWNVLIDGKLAGKMLLVLMPSLISQASGLARIEGNLLLSGKGPRPQIAGTLRFDDPMCGEDGAAADGCRKPGVPPHPLTVIPRGLRRELAMLGGSLDIATDLVGGRPVYRVSVSDATMTIDGEGTVSGIDGDAELRDDALAHLALRLDADAIPFRIPGKLDLVVSASDVVITKRSETSNLDVRGDISIIDGTYRQDLEIAETIKLLGSSTPPTTPVWDVYPTLGNAHLELGIDVRKFQIKSNVATIDLAGDLRLSETPKDPRLDGQIRVERGRFRLPGMRAAFTKSSGTINFDEDRAASNPELRVQSEADYRDLNGQDHVITLKIEGHADALTWDLTTSTGYNKSQTVSLLLLGRNPEQLRRSLGDQSLGGDPTVVDPSTNPSQGFADQIVKDLAGDWVSDLLQDSLTKIVGLDVLRLEVGFNSIGLHVEKRLFENINVLGTTEQTFRGRTINARTELKTPYPLSVQAGYLKKDFIDPAEEDIKDYNLTLVYRLFIP